MASEESCASQSSSSNDFITNLFVYSRRGTTSEVTVRQTTAVAITVGVKDPGGFSKLGTIPGGGFKAGILERSGMVADMTVFADDDDQR